MNKEQILTTYKVISKIMEEIMEDDHLTKDNSFLRVKNYLANIYCDYCINEKQS